MDKAILIHSSRLVFPDRAIVAQKIWKLPEPTRERPHGIKCRLYYGKDGERIIGYDNETGKGDHRHYRNKEEPYHFTSPQELLEDFWRDIKAERGEKT